MAFVHFYDMHSGGGSKEKWNKIIIECDSKEEAVSIFYSKFGHNPDRVSCTCCGSDYSITQEDSLEEVTGYDRNAIFYHNPKKKNEGRYFDREEDVPKGWKREGFLEKHMWEDVISLEVYLKSKDVKVIYAKDITDKDRHQDVPVQGYVYI